MEQPTPKQLEQACREWNAAHPEKAEVRFWTGVSGLGEPKTGMTRIGATILGGHTAGCYITGSGFVALSHIEGA